MILCFPDLYPDELLYSGWARFSDRVQYLHKGNVLQDLFGNKFVRPIVDFPCRIKYFVEHLLKDTRYTVDYLIDYHALLPLYSPFLPQDRVDCIRKQMINGEVKALHRHVGSGMILSPIWLRYCSACVETDRKKFGACYWHRLHQVPGVEICPIHNVLLDDSTVRTRNGNLCEFGIYSAEASLSKDLTFSKNTTYSVTSSPSIKILTAIASNASYLLQHSTLPINAHFLRQQYHSLLAQQGFMTPQGRVRLFELVNAFTDYYSSELLCLLHAQVKTSGQLDSTWLARLFHIHEANKNQSVHHPLYHILAIHFLSSSVETFIQNVFTPPTLFGNGPWPCLNPVCAHYHQRKILTYEIGEVRIKGKPIAKFSCTCGYTYCRTGPDTSSEDAFRKGKVLSYGVVWETKLRELWTDPTVRLKNIALCLGVKCDTVNQQALKLNLPVPRLSSRTIKLKSSPFKMDKDVSWYRFRWLSLIEENPNVATYIVRRKAKGIYTWLVRNDKDWLNVHKPPRPKTKNNTANNKKYLFSKDKASLDALIAENVRTIAYELLNEDGYPVRITMNRIWQKIPYLRNKPSSTNAPLTLQALAEVAESQRTFAVRKVKWLLQQYIKEQVCPEQREFILRANFKEKILRVPLVQQAIKEALFSLAQSAQNAWLDISEK